MSRRTDFAETPRPLIHRVELVEQVTTQLRQEILDGRFGPDGELPVEAELTKAYGVSRTVTREALRTLRSQGFVEVRQGRRPRVKPVDAQVATQSLGLLIRRGSGSLLNVTEVRLPIEMQIAALAADRWQEQSQIDELHEIIRRQSAAPTLDAQIAADDEFHRQLAVITGNALFPLLLAAIAPLLFESRKRTISQVGSTRTIDGHASILAAVERRDGVAARQAMLTHISKAKEDLSISHDWQPE